MRGPVGFPAGYNALGLRSVVVGLDAEEPCSWIGEFDPPVRQVVKRGDQVGKLLDPGSESACRTQSWRGSGGGRGAGGGERGGRKVKSLLTQA